MDPGPLSHLIGEVVGKRKLSGKGMEKSSIAPAFWANPVFSNLWVMVTGWWVS